MQEDHVLFEMDMERQYNDPSWGLDTVNAELQLLSESAMDAEIEAAYDEMLDSIMNCYNPKYEEFDF